MINQLNVNETIDKNELSDGTNEVHPTTNNTAFNIFTIFIFIQAICSCLAGVYNEHILKNAGANVNIYIQNVFMYIDSIVCNVGILLVQGSFFNAFTLTSLKSIFSLNVILIMINNAAIGIVTSFFLKYLNSILKTFASALELLFTAVLCYILFGIPIYMKTVLAIAVVSFSIYLYSQNPVKNDAGTGGDEELKKSNILPVHRGDKQKLLDSNNSDDTDNE